MEKLIVPKIRILIFIGSLRSGGKERRLVELLTYLSSTNEFEFVVVVTKDEVHYQNFFKLNIQYRILEKKWKRNDPTIFYKFYKIAKEFRPQVIHTWGRMQSIYTLPVVVAQRVPLINSQITGAPITMSRWSLARIIDKISFRYSRVILANSKAGIEAYNPPINKCKVIYNGINLNRFNNLPDVGFVKRKYAISTPHAVIMTASFTFTKDYGLFFRIADKVTKLRSDITFIGVGGYDQDDGEYKKMLELSGANPRILFPGKIHDVEALVNACTIGVLFSTNGEGISNSIMEYMALAKPVIANRAGGMKELVQHNINGYLVEDETEEEIITLMLDFINNPEKRKSFGECGKRIIAESFSVEKMGSAFKQVYTKVVNSKESVSSHSFLPSLSSNDGLINLKEFVTIEKNIQ